MIIKQIAQQNKEQKIFSMASLQMYKDSCKEINIYMYVKYIKYTSAYMVGIKVILTIFLLTLHKDVR